MLYESGQGVSQSYAEAAKWFRKAADLGDDVAQNNLGRMYYTGQGVPKDWTSPVSVDTGLSNFHDRLELSR